MMQNIEDKRENILGKIKAMMNVSFIWSLFLQTLKKKINVIFIRLYAASHVDLLYINFKIK